MNRTWRQSTAKRTIRGAQFTQGVIDFDFSVGSNTVFIPSKSYFRIAVKLTGVDPGGGARLAPTLAEQLAFANFCPGNMFDNSFFYAGGQNVSSCINYGMRWLIVSANQVPGWIQSARMRMVFVQAGVIAQ